MMMNDDDINEQMLQLSEEEDDPDEAKELENDFRKWFKNFDLDHFLI